MLQQCLFDPLSINCPACVVCSKKVILYLNGLRVALRGTSSVVSSKFQVEGAEQIKTKTILFDLALNNSATIPSFIYLYETLKLTCSPSQSCASARAPRASGCGPGSATGW